MAFAPFEIEAYLSRYEQRIRYNYSESGVQPLSLGELLALAGKDPGYLADTSLNYPEVNGQRELRERIATRYPGASADNVLVTVGASEANLLAATTLLAPGDEVVALTPTYLQFTGIASNLGFTVRRVALRQEADWALDVEALNAAVNERTRVVAVVNPNNPTGRILSEMEMAAVVTAAERVGAWLLADEVYAGSERDGGAETPSFYGRYPRVVALNSLSKAYGLPGLRIGWVVASDDIIEALWRRHEYAVVSTTALANRLALLALDEAVRPRIIARTRALVRDGFALLEQHLARHEGVFSVVPPQASALSFVRYRLPLSSRELAARLREHDVLMVPGECFGQDFHLRIASALPPDLLNPGLERLNTLVESLMAQHG